MDFSNPGTSTNNNNVQGSSPGSTRSTAEAIAPVETGQAQAAEDLPDYLFRYYRWAYVWPFAVWFFDHQPIINAILFGNYRRIMNHTLRMLEPEKSGRTLQIAAVYGELTPTLADRLDELHMIDVADVQLRAARRKLDARGLDATITRMNAEHLDYADDSFDTAVIFLLLHEMPPEARRNTLHQAIRVVRPGGRLVIAEYGEEKKRHFLHRFWPTRFALATAEPFLGSFWKTDLQTLLAESAQGLDKHAELDEHVDVFGGFYRVMSYRIAAE